MLTEHPDLITLGVGILVGALSAVVAVRLATRAIAEMIADKLQQESRKFSADTHVALTEIKERDE